MFWTLVLAHLTADYPLQSSALVEAKREWRGLAVHITIHFAVLMVFTLGAWGESFRYVIALVLAHLAIDFLKNILSQRISGWQVTTYFFDQFLHLISILLVFNWAMQSSPGLRLPLAGQWQIYAVALLLVTHIWFITERIIYHHNERYLAEVNAQYVPRMLARLVLMAGFLFAWRAFFGQAAATAGVPYFSGRYRTRALLIDLAVAAFVGAFLLWAL